MLHFDRLAPVDPDEVIGRWHGSGLHTGHPLDGLLERFGWYGKRFESPEAVYPLLFSGRSGKTHSVDPARLPMGLALRKPWLARANLARALFNGFLPILSTSVPTARLRKIEYRGVASTAIFYDRIPVIDHLRAVDGEHVIGLMDSRHLTHPFFFLLLRDQE